MATLEKRRWSGDFTGPTRHDRQPCDYEVIFSINSVV